MSFGSAEEKGGQALAVLMMELFDHLTHCILKRPPIHEYLANVLKDSTHTCMPLSFEFFVNLGQREGVSFAEQIGPEGEGV